MADITPNSVVSGLLDLSRELAELSKDLDQLEIDAVNSREGLVAETAEALVRGRKRQLDSLKIRIDVGRSAAAALRAEITLGGVH